MISMIKSFGSLKLTGKRLWLIGGALFVMLVAIIIRDKPAATASGSRWVHVQPQSLTNELGLVGRIESASQAIIAAPFEGVIKDIAIIDGIQVEQGQVLLTLDTTYIDIQLREALAAKLKAQRALQDLQHWSSSEEVSRARRAVANIQLALTDTQQKLTETRRLFEVGIVARMEVDALEQQLKMQQLDESATQAELRAALGRGGGENRQIAEMELANSQARYRAIQNQLKQRQIQAPFSGVIIRPKNVSGESVTTIQRGGRVTPGMPLFELVGLESIKAVARVEEADLHQLRKGMQVRVTGDGFEGTTLDGYVTSIGAKGAPSELSGGITYEVAVSIPPLTLEQQDRIRLGMSARLTITIFHVANGLAVPPEALRRSNTGTTYVIYRHAENSPSHKVVVKAGRAVPQGIEVSGLEEGFVELPEQL